MGIDYDFFGLFIFLTLGLGNLVMHAVGFLCGLMICGVFIAGWFWFGRWMTKTDPEFLTILVSSMSEKRIYDPKLYDEQEVIYVA